MKHYERSYATARSVLSFMELVGWAVAGLGALAALVGLSSGGMMSSLYGDPPMAARLISAVPGMIAFLGGIFAVSYAQTGRAGVDTAEMTRELLTLTKSGASVGGESSSAISAHMPAHRAPESEQKAIRHEGNGSDQQTSISQEMEDRNLVVRKDGLGRFITYKGHRISLSGQALTFGGARFDSVQDVIDEIDRRHG